MRPRCPRLMKTRATQGRSGGLHVESDRLNLVCGLRHVQPHQVAIPIGHVEAVGDAEDGAIWQGLGGAEADLEKTWARGYRQRAHIEAGRLEDDRLWRCRGDNDYLWSVEAIQVTVDDIRWNSNRPGAGFLHEV